MGRNNDVIVIDSSQRPSTTSKSKIATSQQDDGGLGGILDDNNNDEDDSEIRRAQSKDKRFELWFVLFFCSTVTFGVLVDLFWANGLNVGNFIATFLAFVNTIVTGSYTIKIYRINEDPISGSAVELCFIVQTFILWIGIMIYSFTGSDRAVTYYGTVQNANLFHSVWIGFGILISLLFEFLRAFRDLDIIESINSKGSRFGFWLILFLASCTTTFASTSMYIQSNCKHPSEASIPPELEMFVQKKDVITFCKRTGYAIGLGATSMCICIMFISELLYIHDNPEQLFESEALFSFLLSICFTVATALITSDNGPGTDIGNLYYATWWSLFACLFITWSCFREYQEKKKSNNNNNNNNETG